MNWFSYWDEWLEDLCEETSLPLPMKDLEIITQEEIDVLFEN